MLGYLGTDTLVVTGLTTDRCVLFTAADAHMRDFHVHVPRDCVVSIDGDDDAFPIYASPTASATKAFSWGLGLNWHLNKNVKVNLNYDQTDFKGGAATDLRGSPWPWRGLSSRGRTTALSLVCPNFPRAAALSPCRRSSERQLPGTRA